MHVGINRVVALFLEFVGGNLGHQADAASFLVEIEHHALAFLLNHLHRLMELLAAVATLAAEDVAGGA